MKQRTSTAPAIPIPEGVRRGEVISLQTLMARLGVGRRQVWQWERQGLRGATAGHKRFYCGDEVFRFFADLTEQQTRGEGLPT